VLIIVGDIADRVSKRKLDPLPKVRVCAVLRESLGRPDLDCGESSCDCCECSAGLITKEVAILSVGIS
jgi:hypothetical protein